MGKYSVDSVTLSLTYPRAAEYADKCSQVNRQPVNEEL
jgi:hypothetical protein